METGEWDVWVSDPCRSGTWDSLVGSFSSGSTVDVDPYYEDLEAETLRSKRERVLNDSEGHWSENQSVQVSYSDCSSSGSCYDFTYGYSFTNGYDYLYLGGGPGVDSAIGFEWAGGVSPGVTRAYQVEASYLAGFSESAVYPLNGESVSPVGDLSGGTAGIQLGSGAGAMYQVGATVKREEFFSLLRALMRGEQTPVVEGFANVPLAGS